MIILKNKECAWISEEEINNTISGLKNGFKIYETSVKNKVEDFVKEYYLYIRKLKKKELSTGLFEDINSWIGSICYGIPEIEFGTIRDETLKFRELCNNTVTDVIFECDNKTKYYVTYIDPKYRNGTYISGY